MTSTATLTKFDTVVGGIVYTTNPNAVDPAHMYRRLAAEFGKDAFAVMLDAGQVIRDTGRNMMHRKADKCAVMHPGDIDAVEAILFDQYLTATTEGMNR